jgi:RNA polymerase sigma-32 factor
MLTHAEERALFHRWRDQRDQRALHRLILAYVPFANKLAYSFRHYGLDLIELRQEASLGLMEAAMRFEVERDLRFSTFALWLVRARLLQYVLHTSSIVAVGGTVRQRRLFFKLRGLRDKLARARPHLSASEIDQQAAAKLAVNQRVVEEMRVRLESGDLALDAPSPRGVGSPLDSLADSAPTPEEAVLEHREAVGRISWFRQALEQLSERERLILTQRRMTDAPVPLKDIGAKLGVTAERVRQIEAATIRKLQSLAGASPWASVPT